VSYTFIGASNGLRYKLIGSSYLERSFLKKDLTELFPQPTGPIILTVIESQRYSWSDSMDSRNNNIIRGQLGDLTSWRRVTSLTCEGITGDDLMSADGWQYVIHDCLSGMIVGSLRVGD